MSPENLSPENSHSANVVYQVDLLRFDVMARIKGDHAPTDLSTDLHPLGYYEASDARIAAGGVANETHEHEADIVMRVRRQSGGWGYGTPMSGLPRKLLPRLRVSNREGVEKPAKTFAQSGSTDGNGLVLSDMLRSRDLESRWNSNTAGVSLSPNVGSNWVPIYMEWASVEWKMGANGEKEWDHNFFVGLGERKEWLWTKIKFNEEIPLTTHSIKFVVTRLQVREKDENGKEVERIYTTVPIEPNSVRPDDATDLTPEIVLVPQIDASAFLKFAPEVATDETPGVYKTQLTILKNPEQTLKHFIVELEDQNVYLPRH